MYPARAVIVAMLAMMLAGCEPLSTPLPPAAGSPTPEAEVPAPTEAYPAPVALAADAGQRRFLPWAGRSDPVPAAAALLPSGSATIAAPDQAPSGSCPAGIARRQGDQIVLDGQPVFFFGLNATHFLDKEYPEEKVEPLLAALSERGVNALRVWYFDYHDPERLQRLLELGDKYGIRFVVTLGDNVDRGRDWFFGDDDEETYRPHLEATVARFKDRPEILMWDVLNEPNCGERFDEECMTTIREWLSLATGKVKAIDPCHLISTGMIGDGNSEDEERWYKGIHAKGSVSAVSQHRRATEETFNEVAIAEDIERPIFFGEIYYKAYDAGCEPLNGGQDLRDRAETVKDDLAAAIDMGVDGYLLWDLNAGRAGDREFCSEFGYDPDDPLWAKLRDAGLPPKAPWQP
jgi:hypothetical protein